MATMTATKKKAPPDERKAMVRILRSLKVRAKTYASMKDRALEDVLSEAVREYLEKRGA